MTKTITISYQEADENVLMSIFKKFKVKTAQLADTQRHNKSDADPQPTDKEFLAELQESIDFVNAHKCGHIKLPSFDESMKRMRQELIEEGVDIN